MKLLNFIFLCTYALFFCKVNAILANPINSDVKLFRVSSRLFTPNETFTNAEHQDGQWHYVAIVKAKDRSGSVYVDGVKVSGGEWKDRSYFHVELNLGVGYYTSYDGFFNGIIDEIRISDKIRSAAEISNHFQSGSPFSNDGNTIGLWHFDEGSGNTINNSVGSSGSLIGGVSRVSGKFGAALSFDGVNDRGDLNLNLPENKDLTFEFYVKGDNLSGTIMQAYGLHNISIQAEVETKSMAYPVPYAGKVAVNGENFSGKAKFTFSIVEANGTTHWINGADADEIIEVPVTGGRYLVLLGGQGMNPLPTDLFLTQPELYLKVMVDLSDGQGLRHLAPDQRITSTPHALSAEVARRLLPGTVTLEMLALDARTKVEANATIPHAAITPDMLSPDTLAKFDQPISRNRLPQDVLADLNGTIPRWRLSADVLDDLNDSIKTITRAMLPADVRYDLNGTIPRWRLSPDVLDDLNDSIKTITRAMLPADVRYDLNGTIPRWRLSADVLDDLNESIKTITRAMLPADVRYDLNGTIPRWRLSADVLDDLNDSIKTITRAMLPADVRYDLNGTIPRWRLSPDVLTDLNRTITRDNLAQDVLADLNRTVGKPDLDDLILKYLSPEITAQPLSQTVYTDDNVTIEVSAEGKYVSYQWKKNGVDLAGKTSPTLVLTEANATLHDGNYSVSVSNEFGTVTSNLAVLTVKIPPHFVQSASNLEMLWVESGTFTMGSPTTEVWRQAEREHEHTVTLTRGFYLGKYEVTQAQYEAVMTGNPNGLSTTPSKWPNNPNRPVEQVHWGDIQVFLARLNAAEQAAGRLPTGWSYILPTESQWEYACRAGTNTVFSWGNSASSAQANLDGTQPYGGGAIGVKIGETTNVGQYGANQWGFFDMHGNVFEWTADWYGVSSSNAQTDPQGPVSGSRRVTRGGSWGHPGKHLRSALRDHKPSGSRYHSIGFRVGFKAVPDTTPPVVTLLGDANVTHAKDVAWVDPGATASDTLDGNLTNQVTITGTVDVNSTGAYVLTYTVSDAAGNDSNVTRTVNVVMATTRVVDLNATVAMQMLWVEPGTFTMGSPTSEAGRGTNEAEHNVTLTNGFYLGKYEVTQAQYQAVMTGNTNSLSATPSQWPNNPNRPVEKVSWDDAQIFLTRLNAAEQAAGRLPAGWSYVLPTESEWEYASRSGTTTAYSLGNSIAASNANYLSSGIGQTRDVGQYAANPWGFFDMHGNVHEWVADWYQTAYPSGTVTDPKGPASGSLRVLRGGSWSNGSGSGLRSARRPSYVPGHRNSSLGFRLAFKAVQSDDVTDPEFTLSGDSNMTHSVGMPWIDPGVEAHDARDGNLTSQITISGTVDVNSTGAYVLTYTVSDAAGNDSNVTRTVNVVMATTRVVDLNATVAMQMLWVEPGTFTMGSPTTETGRSTNETEHTVTLTKGFYLGKYEVTQAQYQAVMTGNTNGLSATPSQYSGNDRPVEKVTWDDVQVFLTRLNAAEQAAGRLPAGWSYVLPTESEWEYACRAGTTTVYSWGSSIATSNANYEQSVGQTRDVGQYEANPWGFFDMHGNVFEWTADWYAASYPTGSVTDPVGPATGSNRVWRGGSWYYTASLARSAIRGGSVPANSNNSLGFRLSLRPASQ
jgi:formylglycine-generating enzyme required for sulfatase activity